MPTRLQLANPTDPQQVAIAARFRTTRDVVYRKSTNVEGATWREVSRFSGVAASQLGAGDPLIAESIRASVRLADDLFLSYDDAELTVDPVLLFYGSMWLAAALIYARSASATQLDNVGHGMQVTFGVGNRVLLDATIQMRNSGRAHMLSSGLAGSDLADQKLRLVEVLPAVPELDPFLQELGVDGTSAIPVIVAAEYFSGAKIVARMNGKQLVGLGGTPTAVTEIDLQNTVATLAALVDRQAELEAAPGRNLLTWPFGPNEDAELRTLFMVTAAGDLYLERLLPGGLYLPELVVHLIILFALSNLARYHPREWLKMYDDYTLEYRLVREFVEVSQAKFPNLVLNELSGKTYMFE